MNLEISIVRRLLIVILAALALGAVACGGAGATSTPDATSTPAATSPAQGPGVIAVSSTAISGQSGRILLVFAMPAGGGGQLARLCTPITSDDFTLSGAVMTEMPPGDNPCSGDTAQTTFEEGTYDLVAGVYVGGQQTPEAQTTVTVQVAGDTTTVIDGSDLSS